MFRSQLIFCCDLTVGICACGSNWFVSFEVLWTYGSNYKLAFRDVG